jgi:hypothetical protein
MGICAAQKNATDPVSSVDVSIDYRKSGGDHKGLGVV